MQLLVILGPTASGKTHVAVQAARHLNGEILSAERITQEEEGVFRAEGYVDLRRGEVRLQADWAVYDRNEEKVEAGGLSNVHLYQNCF